MKSLVNSVLVALFLIATASVSNAAYIGSHNVQGCSFWAYSSIAGAYVCSNPDLATAVPDIYAVQNAISTLEQQNQELLKRIQALEARR